MEHVTHLHLRAARDRLIDLLGFGETYPLQDVTVHDERLTVPFDQTAKIPICPGQADVVYELYDRDEVRVAVDPVTGTGEETLLASPAIAEDITFKIRATKIGRETRWDYLHDTATVKVGLDVSLAARILAPVLDLTVESPTDADARIVDFGSSVEVEVDGSQEGVDYRLVHVVDGEEVVVSVEDVRGDLHTIVLRTLPMSEDTEIRIRAIKTFDPADGRETQTALLDAVLPLAVRADQASAVAVAGAQVVDFGQGTTVTVAGSRSSVSYQVWIRDLSDRDFVYGDGPEVIRVPVEGEEDARILKPAPPAVWDDPAGYVADGETLTGTGGELTFTLPALEEDALVIVRATKEHQGDEVTVPSAVQLDDSAVVLVRPNPDVALTLEAPVAGSSLAGTLLVGDGQPGVFYYFRPSGADAELDRPAYFHKLDELDRQQNKGVDQLRPLVDFVVARDPEPGDIADLSLRRPELPLLDAGSLAVDLTLSVRAVKARSRVAVPLHQSAEILDLPEIRLEDEVVDAGAGARIEVLAGRQGERYQPFLDDEPVAEAQDGNGGDLTFTTPALDADTTFDLRVTRPSAPGLAVTRVALLTATVIDMKLDARNADVEPLDPTNESPADLDPRIIGYGATVRVEIERSESGVDYRLVHLDAGGEEIALSEEHAAGNLGSIHLLTRPLYEDTEIRIRATRTGTSLSTLLNAALPLAVRADPAVAVAVDPTPVVGYGAGSTVTVAGSQASVSYQLYVRSLADQDFVYGEVAEGTDVACVAVAGEDDVQVLSPESQPVSWGDPEGYAAHGEALAGNGGELRLPLTALTEDSLVIVRASKQHAAGDATLPSALQLEQVVVVLVEPDPAVVLTVTAAVEAGVTTGTMEVTGGQSGVLYYFRQDAEGVGLPAYFHDLDKGTGELRTEVDFVVAGEPSPVPPVVEIGQRSVPLTLNVRAVKARTRVGVDLAAGVEIAAAS